MAFASGTEGATREVPLAPQERGAGRAGAGGGRGDPVGQRGRRSRDGDPAGGRQAQAPLPPPQGSPERRRGGSPERRRGGCPERSRWPGGGVAARRRAGAGNGRRGSGHRARRRRRAAPARLVAADVRGVGSRSGQGEGTTDLRCGPVVPSSDLPPAFAGVGHLLPPQREKEGTPVSRSVMLTLFQHPRATARKPTETPSPAADVRNWWLAAVGATARKCQWR